MVLYASLITTGETTCQYPIIAPSLCFLKSTIQNIRCSSTVGCGIFDGFLAFQSVRICSFTNVTSSIQSRSPRSLQYSSVVIDNAIESTVISDGNSDVCSPISNGVSTPIRTFCCKNSTFLRNTRDPIRGAFCPSHALHYVKNGVEFVSEEYTSQQNISEEGEVEYSFINCTFTGCSGGAICLEGTSDNTTQSLSVTRCVFTNCTTSTDGGGIYCSESSCVISDSNFTSCHAMRGGGIYFQRISSDEASITNSEFVVCTATSLGGGVAVRNRTSGDTEDTCGLINECTFDSCTSTSSAGAILLSDVTVCVGISFCVFTSCTANIGGLR